jgi:hypothetical protein
MNTPPNLPPGIPPHLAEQAAELNAYNAAFQTAQADGGARESILAILHAAEPPGLQDGTFQRMSFGLDWLLEATGNGREHWTAMMQAGSMKATNGRVIIESLFIFSNPDAALESLGLGGDDVMAFRKAANAFARSVPDETVAAAVPWMTREILRYWGWLPFLEAAAAVEAPVPPQKPDGSSSISTGSAPTTRLAFTPPSGSSSQPRLWHCGLPLSKDGAGNIPAPASPTKPASPPPAPSAPAARPPAVIIEEIGEPPPVETPRTPVSPGPKVRLPAMFGPIPPPGRKLPAAGDGF